MELSSPSQKPESRSGAGNEEASQRAETLNEPTLTILALVRIFFGLLWVEQLVWKMPPTYGGLRSFVEREVQATIVPGYGFIVKNIFLANFPLLGTGVWTTELLVAVSLLLGLFTHFGAALALLLSLQLYIGLAYAPGEWYWTYGMLILLSLVLLVVPAGRRLGLDQLLAPRFQSSTANPRLIAFLRWLV
jgi:hypothetical protein